jgi:phosphatidylglycerol---prolipoprotein diacylglyceryl transferase
MQKILFMIPGLGLQLHSFSLMLVLACFGALVLTARRARRERLDPENVYDLAGWLFIGGFMGARALFLIQNPGSVHHWTDVFKVWEGGIIFYGCILGGLAGTFLYWARHRFPFRAMADAVAPSLALGIALGRIGCFLNGCCYGSVSHAPWAMRFPTGTFPWYRHVHAGWIPPSALYSLPVHPKQLYAALAGFLLLGLLTAYYPRRRRDGEVMALLMIAYPITRFLVEFFRGDAGGLYAGFTISQYISLGLFVGGLGFWFWLLRQPLGRFADLGHDASATDELSRTYRRASRPHDRAEPVVGVAHKQSSRGCSVSSPPGGFDRSTA